jgi:hypothetical protein
LVLESSSFGREFEAELQEKVRTQTFRLRGGFGNEGGKQIIVIIPDHSRSFQIIPDHFRSFQIIPDHSHILRLTLSSEKFMFIQLQKKYLHKKYHF